MSAQLENELLKVGGWRKTRLLRLSFFFVFVFFSAASIDEFGENAASLSLGPLHVQHSEMHVTRMERFL